MQIRWWVLAVALMVSGCGSPPPDMTMDLAVPADLTVGDDLTVGEDLSDTGDASGTCSSPGDCPATGNECITATCDNHVCGTSFVDAGTPTSVQTAHDCHENRCDGAGHSMPAVDDNDAPADDGNPCTSDSCSGGVSQHPNKATGTACSQGVAHFCDGNGACVQCLSPTDCTAGTACQTRTCSGTGTCGLTNLSFGTVVANPVVGDCRSDQCDGSGAVTADAEDDTDTPADDGKQCTNDICSGGVAQHPNKATGTGCNQGSGHFCDGNGACVECLMPSDCGTKPVCQTRTCSGSGTCGTNNDPMGLVVSNPVLGDCRSDQCDGSGGVTTNAPDNSDLPADDGLECTNDTCSGGNPVHPPKAGGTPCSTMGGTQCDGAGACIP